MTTYTDNKGFKRRLVVVHPCSKCGEPTERVISGRVVVCSVCRGKAKLKRAKEFQLNKRRCQL